MSYLKNYLFRVTGSEQRSSVIAFLAALDNIQETAPSVATAIIQELKDQRSNLKLIASENYSSLTSQLAMGNLLNDKAAEGYAYHRFFSGCDNIDVIEQEAIEELKTIFGCEHAFVQSHSGSDANLLALWSILIHKVQTPQIEKLGKKTVDELTSEEYEEIRRLFAQQKMVAMSLASGGHLSHGFRHNISSKIIQSISYDVDPETECIDYQSLSTLVKLHKPLILLAGYSSHPRQINFAKMREIAESVGAVLLVDMSHFAGFVAAKIFTGDFNPVPFADLITSTTYKTMRGPRGAFLLCTNEYRDILNKGCPLVLGSPAAHIIAAKLVSFKETNTLKFCNYAQQVVDNAQHLASHLLEKKIRLVTGGTENHMLILDLSSFGLTGRQGEWALRQAFMTTNRNMIPFDQKGPWYTSGVRIGTQAITSLGMGKKEMDEIGEVIVELLSHTKPITHNNKISKSLCEIDPKILQKCKERVQGLIEQFPLYPEIVI